MSKLYNYSVHTILLSSSYVMLEFILTDYTSLSAAELFLKHLYIFLTYTNKKKYIMQQNNEWFTRMIYLNVVILT